MVWVEQGRFVQPIHVNVGLTDGTLTEVESTDLREGMRVVVGEATLQEAGGPSAGSSPFTPQLGHGPRQGQSGTAGPGGGR